MGRDAESWGDRKRGRERQTRRDRDTARDGDRQRKIGIDDARGTERADGQTAGDTGRVNETETYGNKQTKAHERQLGVGGSSKQRVSRSKRAEISMDFRRES